MIRPVAKFVGALVLMAMIAGGIIFALGWKLRKELNPDPVTVVSASLQAVREQAVLVPFAARFVAVATSEQHRFGFSAKQTLIMPGMVRYELDLAALQPRDLGWDAARAGFCDLDERPVRAAFKLYPWEFMVKDAFGPVLAHQPRPCAFLEPAWKMLLSNKALLAILWELFPQSAYLLPAYLDGPRDLASYVKKPILAREGANVEIHQGGSVIAAPPMDCYGAEGHVYQSYAPIPEFDGFRPVLGAWIVDGEPAGMGIREDRGLITGNGSSFVPHLIEG